MVKSRYSWMLPHQFREISNNLRLLSKETSEIKNNINKLIQYNQIIARGVSLGTLLAIFGLCFTLKSEHAIIPAGIVFVLGLFLYYFENFELYKLSPGKKPTFKQFLSYRETWLIIGLWSVAYSFVVYFYLGLKTLPLIIEPIFIFIIGIGSLIRPIFLQNSKHFARPHYA